MAEKDATVDGLGRRLPARQDTPIRPADRALDGVPLARAAVASAATIERWVQRSPRAEVITLQTPVEDGWDLRTRQGAVRARLLVAATGAHYRLRLPAVERQALADEKKPLSL